MSNASKNLRTSLERASAFCRSNASTLLRKQWRTSILMDPTTPMPLLRRTTVRWSTFSSTSTQQVTDTTMTRAFNLLRAIRT